MVFASICEHVSSAFIFASTSSDQIYLVSSEHFKDLPKIEMALRKFSTARNLSMFYEKETLFCPK